MKDTERELADCVGAIYQAGAGDGSWLDVGDRICRIMDARRALLVLGGPGGPRNVLMPADGSESAYSGYFHARDPYAAKARHDFATARAHHLGNAKLGAELVAENDLLRSEYYFDFARHHERRHVIGGMAGLTEATPILVSRGDESGAFDETHIRLLKTLMPHVQRAIELRARLGREYEASALTRAALDALPVGVGVVDAGLKIRFVNDLARRYLAGPDSGLFSMRSGPYAGSGVYLAAMSREETSVLRRLVASATSGGTGGAMRVTSRSGAVVGLMVAPAPQGLAAEVSGMDGGAAREALALLILRPLDRKVAPQADMLCEMFGFSRAEAEVAIALTGGASAEDVARGRGVSLMTVRSQIRSILGKSEAENLRDFERTMATLGAFVPQLR
ncbi:PAS domain-containing protein [Ancylobacter amanitiformis]|uniref:PAS domain-containing protein n=1 Tax=Ancylobacter amanitiformis TaxID=217069 RepID=A0ABU0LML6_9HYPH|nr:PAS domain-containing protein [Ancylobacter amanitiformis]MDQ0509927.1 PAS domain-containing protein [Ancylobacter amanitiformis]